VKTLSLIAAVLLAVTTAVSADDETPPVRDSREPSLAERAEAAKKNAESAAAKNKNRKPSDPRILNNDDLKKAKGNVIYLHAPASVAPSRVTADSPLPADGAPAEVPVARMSPLPAVGAPAGDLLRELDENRGRALRLRGNVEDAQKAWLDAAPEARPAVEERLRATMNELLQTHEAIGVLLERMRQSDPSSKQ
jgi:hypothetical protein